MSIQLTRAQIEAVKDHNPWSLPAEPTATPKLNDALRLVVVIVDDESMQNVALTFQFTHHPYASLGAWTH